MFSAAGSNHITIKGRPLKPNPFFIKALRKESAWEDGCHATHFGTRCAPPTAAEAEGENDKNSSQEQTQKDMVQRQNMQLQKSKEHNMTQEHRSLGLGAQEPMPKSMEQAKEGSELLSDVMFSHYIEYRKNISRFFSDLPPEHRFWLQSGETLENLFELYKAFSSMSRHVFRHHANDNRNDFADWVENIYNDCSLASAIRHSRTPKEAKEAVNTRILELHGNAPADARNDKANKNDKGIFTIFLNKIMHENNEMESRLEEKKKELLEKQVELRHMDKVNKESYNRIRQRFADLKRLEETVRHKMEMARSKEETISFEVNRDETLVDNEISSLKELTSEINMIREKNHPEEAKKELYDKQAQLEIIQQQNKDTQSDLLNSYKALIEEENALKQKQDSLKKDGNTLKEKEKGISRWLDELKLSKDHMVGELKKDERILDYEMREISKLAREEKKNSDEHKDMMKAEEDTRHMLEELKTSNAITAMDLEREELEVKDDLERIKKLEDEHRKAKAELNSTETNITGQLRILDMIAEKHKEGLEYEDSVKKKVDYLSELEDNVKDELDRTEKIIDHNINVVENLKGKKEKEEMEKESRENRLGETGLGSNDSAAADSWLNENLAEIVSRTIPQNATMQKDLSDKQEIEEMQKMPDKGPLENNPSLNHSLDSPSAEQDNIKVREIYGRINEHRCWLARKISELLGRKRQEKEEDDEENKKEDNKLKDRDENKREDMKDNRLEDRDENKREDMK
ncbi:hypothetical protein JXB31_05775, partial [Candidatus Woesearchaeota archaeon]|nr:hypothetical protein [Candidatus Woesearchaeota archaeon]